MACDPPPGAPTQFSDALSNPTGDALLPSVIAQTPRGAAWRTDEVFDGHHSSYQHRFWRAVCEPLIGLYVKGWKLSLASTACTLSGPEDAANNSLDDWEREFGLPDECLAGQSLTADRRKLLLRMRVASKGGQSREFFTCLAATLGYSVTVKEYAPFRCGQSRCGKDKIGSSINEVFWEVFVTTTTLDYFRAGKSRVGKDPLGSFGRRRDLECLLNKWKPAHTQVKFHYVFIGGFDFETADWNDADFLTLEPQS